MTPTIQFLTLRDVLILHDLSLETFGGEAGVRDQGLLESALAQPAQSFSSQYLHQFPTEMAAAYGYHLARNHPFFDGNKRTAWLATQTFLDDNGFELSVTFEDGVATMLA